MATKKKKKTGPPAMGLGPMFSIRLEAAQDMRVRADADNAGVSKSEIIRRALTKAWRK